MSDLCLNFLVKTSTKTFKLLITKFVYSVADLEEKLKTSNEFANLLKNDLNKALKENEKLRKFAQNYEKLEQMCQTKSHRLLKSS